MEETCNSKGPITPPTPQKRKNFLSMAIKLSPHAQKLGPHFYFYFFGVMALGMDCPSLWLRTP
jgi:hypothetical protein